MHLNPKLSQSKYLWSSKKDVRERMSWPVKRLKRAVVHVTAGGKASLMTCRVAAECLLLFMEVAAEDLAPLYFINTITGLCPQGKCSLYDNYRMLNRGWKCPNFILSISLSLPNAGIPITNHLLSWRYVSCLGLQPHGKQWVSLASLHHWRRRVPNSFAVSWLSVPTAYLAWAHGAILQII